MEKLLHNTALLYGLGGLSAFAVIALIWTTLIEQDPLAARLKNIANYRAELRGTERTKKLSRSVAVGRIGLMKRIVQQLKLEQGKKIDELRLRLARAGIRSHDMMFVFLFAKFALPIGFFLLAFFLIFVVHAYDLTPFFGLLAVLGAAGAGLVLPDIYIKNASQKREQILRKAMPDALDLMVICAEAGLGLDAAFDRVSREIGPSCAELAEEIGLTAVELSFLPDRSKALQNLADRVPLPGVLAMTNTLIQTERYGTPLAQALRVLSSEMREERIMAAETKGAKLPATLTIPMMLFILPPLFVVIMGPAVLKIMVLMNGQ